MKRKKLLPLLVMLTAGSTLFFSGCGVDVTNINEEEVPISVEMEEQNLEEGTVMLHSVWYDAFGEKLSLGNIAFYDDDSLIFTGTTDESGNMEAFVLPCNTVLYCSVTDESGTPLAECNIILELSENYSELTIYPTTEPADEENLAEAVIEIPIDRTDVRAAIFLTENGAVSFANLTPYIEPEEEVTEEVVEEVVEEPAEEVEVVEEEPAQEEEVVEEVVEVEEETPAEEENNEGGEEEYNEGDEG